jgi:ketosteroid isomerase-like protein
MTSAGGARGTAPEETERNRATITTAFEAWRDRTTPITDVFAPEMTWRIEGHSAASRAYKDKTEFIDEVLAPFGRRFSDGDPFRPVNIRGVYADGDTIIVLWDGRGTTIDDSTYQNSYVVHAPARRQGGRRERVLRQHLVQRSLDRRCAHRSVRAVTTRRAADAAVQRQPPTSALAPIQQAYVRRLSPRCSFVGRCTRRGQSLVFET